MKKHIERKIILVIIFILTVMTLARAKANNKQQYTTYIVQSNDTIWSIAADNNIYSDIRKMVYEIKKINNNKDCIIYAGQEILIPVQK